MFISFSKVLSKVGGFRIGFRKRITSKNALWISLLYLTVVMFQLMWYGAVFAAWCVYAFCYGVYLCIKYLIKFIRTISEAAAEEAVAEPKAIEEPTE